MSLWCWMESSTHFETYHREKYILDCSICCSYLIFNNIKIGYCGITLLWKQYLYLSKTFRWNFKSSVIFMYIALRTIYWDTIIIVDTSKINVQLLIFIEWKLRSKIKKLHFCQVLWSFISVLKTMHQLSSILKAVDEHSTQKLLGVAMGNNATNILTKQSLARGVMSLKYYSNLWSRLILRRGNRPRSSEWHCSSFRYFVWNINTAPCVHSATCYPYT